MKRVIVYSILLITTITMIVIFVSCRKGKVHFRIEFINNTNRDLSVYDAYTYPDTSMNSITWGSYYVEPNTEKALISKNGWDEDLKHHNSSTLMLFVVFGDTLAKYGFDGVASNYNIAKRYDLSIDFLYSVNWTISYP